MIALWAGVILTIFGLGWLITMGAIYALGALTTPDIALPWYVLVLWLGPGTVALLLGIILLIFGLRALKKKRKAKTVILDALQHGVDTKGRVTFVDKNYAITLNERPLFSIVEFEFTDNYGHVFTGRKDQVDSDLVIRNKVEVGGEVDVRYVPEDPSINALLLPDPRVAKRGE
jgi:hypothetical protein